MFQELVVAGGSAVVGAMATESWAVVRERVVRLFRHRGEEELADVEAQLDVDAALMTRSPDVEDARQSLVRSWKRKFARLLDERPEVAAELNALVEQIGVQGESRIQTNIARDNGRVFASLGGNVIVHEAPVPAPHQKGGESGTEG
jgi:hypothetical protein